MIKLTINKKDITAEPGTTILDAALQNGIIIPTLCYMDGTHQHRFGSCRICSVEVKGARTLQVACMTEIKEGMEVDTRSKKVLQTRKVLYELMLSDHSKNCLSCIRNQSCELQKLGKVLNVTDSRFVTGSAREHIDESPAITRNLSKCILCRRCVTVCKEIQAIGILDAQNRGFDTVIAPSMELPFNESYCSYCGQCVVVCPVAALSETDHTQRV
jgi:NADH-quinone oxidoreductase subunit G/NADP-reducing hydrogenase subunit HndD